MTITVDQLRAMTPEQLLQLAKKLASLLEECAARGEPWAVCMVDEMERHPEKWDLPGEVVDIKSGRRK